MNIVYIKNGTLIKGNLQKDKVVPCSVEEGTRIIAFDTVKKAIVITSVIGTTQIQLEKAHIFKTENGDVLCHVPAIADMLYLHEGKFITEFTANNTLTEGIDMVEYRDNKVRPIRVRHETISDEVTKVYAVILEDNIHPLVHIPLADGKEVIYVA